LLILEGLWRFSRALEKVRRSRVVTYANGCLSKAANEQIIDFEWGVATVFICYIER
jgi:hypothetical protein